MVHRSQRSGRGLLGRRIAEVRRAHGWTQEELARRIGIAYKHEQQIEYGNVNISVDLFFLFAERLQVRADILVNPDALEPKRIGRPPKPRTKNLKYQRSRYIGVFGRWGRWYAELTHEGKRVRLGCFDTQRAAAIAYDEAAVRLRGATVRLNFPPG